MLAAERFLRVPVYMRVLRFSTSELTSKLCGPTTSNLRYENGPSTSSCGVQRVDESYVDSIGGNYDILGLINEFFEPKVENKALIKFKKMLPIGRYCPSSCLRTNRLRLCLRRGARRYNYLRRRAVSLAEEFLYKRQPLAEYKNCADENNSYEYNAIRSSCDFSPNPTVTQLEVSGEETTLPPRMAVHFDGMSSETSQNSNYVPARSSRQHAEVKLKLPNISLYLRLIQSHDLAVICSVVKEYSWPKSRRMQTLLSDMFVLLVESSLSIDEIKQLIRELASLDGRAYLHNCVILLFLRRLIRERGIDCGTEYLYEWQRIFLVKAPQSCSERGLDLKDSAQLLEVLLMRDYTDAKIQRFFHVLADAGVNCDISHTAPSLISYHLARHGFESALKLFVTYYERFHQTFGTHVLIEGILKDSKASMDESLSRLRKLLKICSKHRFSVTVAELIVGMVKFGMLSEAKLLLSRFIISGRDFREPLTRLANDQANTVHVEQMADLISDCLFVELRAAKRGRKSRMKAEELGKDVVCSDQFKSYDRGFASFIVQMFERSKRQATPFLVQSPKKYNIDQEDLVVVASIVKDVWIELAGMCNNINSCDKLHKWCLKNELQVSGKQRETLSVIYNSFDKKSPFESV